MQNKFPDITTLTIVISTLLLLVLGSIMVIFLFAYQRKRYRHQQELLVLRESFNQTLLQSKLEIQEQTLNHISRELHANFSHLISVININLSTLSPSKPDEMKEKIAEAKSLVKQLMLEIKALSVSLNTDHIMHAGFQRMLENELNRLSKTKEYIVSFTKTGNEYKISSEKEIILFRMCQEILNNIVKHADAKDIHVFANYSEDSFILEITDDGKGFDLKEVLLKKSETESTGITNLLNRSNLINAKVDINSLPGRGSSVRISTPIL